MTDEQRVIIEHADGRQYSIPRSAFTNDEATLDADGAPSSYEDAGFKMILNEDGTEIAAPRSRRASRRTDEDDEDA